MLFVTKDSKSLVTKITMSGAVDESTDLGRLIGPVNKVLYIYCRDVERINSTGIKAWEIYFRSFRQAGGKIRFFELSSVLVNVLSYYKNFIPKAEIESVCAPFCCESCQHIETRVVSAEDAKEFVDEVPSLKCEKCGGKMAFDEVPSEYFSFTN